MGQFECGTRLPTGIASHLVSGIASRVSAADMHVTCPVARKCKYAVILRRNLAATKVCW